jgi:hypothetical protein
MHYCNILGTVQKVSIVITKRGIVKGDVGYGGKRGKGRARARARVKGTAFQTMLLHTIHKGYKLCHVCMILQ